MSTETKQFPTQIGKSITCDFQENTWTFEMPKKFAFTGGKFAIVPTEEFEKIKIENKMLERNCSRAQDLLEKSMPEELKLANEKIIELRKLLYQVEVFMEQENMNSDYDGIWRDNDETILENVKANTLDE